MAQTVNNWLYTGPCGRHTDPSQSNYTNFDLQFLVRPGKFEIATTALNQKKYVRGEFL
jgi:hypothetical protein